MKKNKKLVISFLVLLVLSIFSFASCNKGKNGVTENQPRRIIALSPVATEMLFAVGAGNQIAACSSYSDYPPEAKDIPSVGGFSGNTISLEAILSFEPDFVCLSNGMHDFLIPQLEQYQIKYYVLYGSSVEQVLQEILELGDLTGHSKEAKNVSSVINSNIQKISKSNDKGDRPLEKNSQDKEDKGDRPLLSKTLVYWEVWNSPYMSAGSTSFINDVIRLSGGENIFADQEQAYPIVSEETIILRQPEVILIPVSSGVSVENVKNRKGWSSIPAVLNDRIYIVDDNLMNRAGPRIDQSIELLNSYLKN